RARDGIADLTLFGRPGGAGDDEGLELNGRSQQCNGEVGDLSGGDGRAGGAGRVTDERGAHGVLPVGEPRDLEPPVLARARFPAHADQHNADAGEGALRALFGDRAADGSANLRLEGRRGSEDEQERGSAHRPPRSTGEGERHRHLPISVKRRRDRGAARSAPYATPRSRCLMPRQERRRATTEGKPTRVSRRVRLLAIAGDYAELK